MVVNDDDVNLTTRGGLRFIASKLAPTGSATTLRKCVHTNVTIGAICVCTFHFSAPKSYILLS
jgi:hypothetical protein